MLQRYFFLKYLKIIKQFARDKGIAVILGAPQALGKKIGNAAIFFNGSKTTKIFKNNLPNYGVFDENFDGSFIPITFLEPIASTAMAALTAESIPPDKPNIIFLKEFL